jgi:uncharacterized protein (TIGR00255 family)
MTGFGDAQQQVSGLTVRVEIRSVNNRHLKLSARLPEGYAVLEAQLETLVRHHVRRGTLQVNLYVTREAAEDDYRINEQVLTSYHRQLTTMAARLHDRAEIPFASLLSLPGVVQEAGPRHLDADAEWKVVEPVVQAALERLNRMRTQEGAALASDLEANCAHIAQELGRIESRAPEVVKAYEVRLLERIQQLLAAHDIQAEPAAVIREVGVFADRVDIREEIVRLRSHLNHFADIMHREQAAGRKLEFLIQEMLRETNTIGSKANDAQVAHHVVQIKTAIERLREMIQNVE